jgi:hypothetical protein
MVERNAVTAPAHNPLVELIDYLRICAKARGRAIAAWLDVYLHPAAARANHRTEQADRHLGTAPGSMDNARR